MSNERRLTKHQEIMWDKVVSNLYSLRNPLNTKVIEEILEQIETLEILEKERVISFYDIAKQNALGESNES
jgi:hypothetical protein